MNKEYKTYKMYNFTEPETGKNIQVAPERWCWGVIYDNDEELHQFDNEGNFHRIGEVDQDRVKLFVLYRHDDPRKRIDLVVQKGMRLIHKYKNIRPFYMNRFVKVYMFGYKLGTKYHYNFILPDDRIVQSSEDNIALEKFELQRT